MDVTYSYQRKSNYVFKLPFGEEIQSGTVGRNSAQGYGGGDNIRQKFTGYERDAETSLDYAKARMFGSSLGRFTSPDDFLNDTHTSDPQSWNLYVYVRNNPIRYVDPSGEIKKDCGKNKDEICTEERKGLERGNIKVGKKIFQQFGESFKGKDGKTYQRIGEVKKVWIFADDGTKIKATVGVGELKTVETTNITAESETDALFGIGSVDEKNIGNDSNPGYSHSCDCHGTSFADGQFWINNDQVKKILKGDNYTLTDTPQIGDIGIFGKYSEKKKDGKTTIELKSVEHSVTVSAVNKGNVTEVISKGGITPKVRTSPNKAWKEGVKVYYWTKRNK
jgi:RHS repeat-associated protein